MLDKLQTIPNCVKFSYKSYPIIRDNYYNGFRATGYDFIYEITNDKQFICWDPVDQSTRWASHKHDVRRLQATREDEIIRFLLDDTEFNEIYDGYCDLLKTDDTFNKIVKYRQFFNY